ncbi:ABC transporter substrate-binding protein [Bifidobacterium crudilactis]|jgi:raffinose/stachyose/melibiose transport system substrate-binding protein|uniref:ABC transporter substrate-binding protein n=1 Tax=Bifidobacterium crudilactis TaxID=327277 RepID=UPI00054D12A6|nr:ABC transporter substrate-binding protein [Bifidobacterium crudilactis]MCI2149515.1 ABC transporter substrate-binding protein [Bifidobacterium crudilactis]MCI2157732.1 ABC transporter substrate-binding protein [Bifidobacterium crudilactis]
MNNIGWKRFGAVAVASLMSVGMLSACGSGSANDTQITIFNSKMEIQEQMEDMAKEYSETKGVDVEVYYSSDTVSAHLATKYASNEPYTLSMVDAKDIYSLAKDHAVDLSDQSWVDDTDQAIAIDGKTYGFPLSIEARGLIYNADPIEKITGEEFDPANYATLDAFRELIATLKKGGLEAPTGVMKEDWSLAAHFLGEVYEEQDDPAEFINELHEGKINLTDNDKFNALMDTFDVLKENNYAASKAISAEREVSEQKLAEGEIAFMFGGNWDWAVLNQYEPSENMGMMPVPQDTDDGSNQKLVGGGSKFFFIDSSENTSDAQRTAAKDFLDWLVNDKEGQKFIVEDCSLVSPFTNNTLPVADPLGASVKQYADAGELIESYNYMPDDHYSVLGAAFQKYLAGESNRVQFAEQIESYWKTAKITTPTE